MSLNCFSTANKRNGLNRTSRKGKLFRFLEKNQLSNYCTYLRQSFFRIRTVRKMAKYILSPRDKWGMKLHNVQEKSQE